MRVPHLIGSWLGEMSRKFHVPQYRIIQVALNEYVDHMPPASRARYRRSLQRLAKPGTRH